MTSPSDATMMSNARFADRLYGRLYRCRVLMNQAGVSSRTGRRPNATS